MTLRLPVVLTLGLTLVLGCAGRCQRDLTGTQAIDKALDRGNLPTFEDPSALTDHDIDVIVKFLAPFVERAAGATFERVPEGRLGTTEALSDVLALETRQIMASIYDVPEPMLERMVEGARKGVPGLLGKYASSTGAVYLSPEGAASAAVSLSDVPDAALSLTLVVMAHELAHALDDQIVGDRFAHIQDLDHFDGTRGISEGHANWVARRVARELELEPVFWRMAEGQGWGPEGLKHPGAFEVFMLYGQGMAFCDHFSQDDPAVLWPLVQAPPRSTTMLFRPERYAPTVEPAVDLRGVLAGVEQVLTRSDGWMTAETHVGEGPLRSELLGVDAGRVDATLAHIVWGHSRLMSVPTGERTPPRNASVMVLGLDSPQAALALVDLAGDGVEAQAQARTEQEAELAKLSPQIVPRTWTVEVSPYDRVTGDRVILRVVGAESAKGSRSAVTEEQALWVVRGSTVVVLEVSGFRPGNRMDKGVDLTFERLAGRLE